MKPLKLSWITFVLILMQNMLVQAAEKEIKISWDLNSRGEGDVGLIDHGQCWVMDNGQRRYYYKGGVPGHCGPVHMMEEFDSEWLNGKRREEPIICENTHMEGILITRVDNTMFLQLSLIWKDRKWRTYTSAADDGINWKLVDEGYYPRLNYNYPQSIGVFQTNEPKWAIGQFLTENGSIGLGYMRII